MNKTPIPARHAPSHTGIIVSDSIYERFMGKMVNVFLTNGVKLSGNITQVDESCFILSEAQDQLVMNHAVATILPQTTERNGNR